MNALKSFGLAASTSWSRALAILTTFASLSLLIHTCTAGVAPYFQTGHVAVPLSVPVTWMGLKAVTYSPGASPEFAPGALALAVMQPAIATAPPRRRTLNNSMVLVYTMGGVDVVTAVSPIARQTLATPREYPALA